MIVGHNPTLSDLVSLLVLGSTQPPICELKKGGIAALTATGGVHGPLRDRLDRAAAARFDRLADADSVTRTSTPVAVALPVSEQLDPDAHGARAVGRRG